MEINDTTYIILAGVSFAYIVILMAATLTYAVGRMDYDVFLTIITMMLISSL